MYSEHLPQRPEKTAVTGSDEKKVKARVCLLFK